VQGVELAPGTILLGKYRIDELIGTGGMGNVVRASHLYLQEAVAIKILLPQMAESESTVQRFLREAQAAVKLKSEHSARVMDVGTTPDGAPFMVMEYLEGNDLNQILRHHGPQLPQIAVDLMVQACEGIAEAHALGIIHRDIKPSNFFITRRPDGSMLLKILDFGISKSPVGYGELTGTQTVIGTPSSMPPEQMKSGRSADPRSDIWSIGVVIYQLLTGRTPFTGSRPTLSTRSA
jgi:eukaryotic-like serine/threonine-protein kinase